MTLIKYFPVIVKSYIARYARVLGKKKWEKYHALVIG